MKKINFLIDGFQLGFHDYIIRQYIDGDILK